VANVSIASKYFSDAELPQSHTAETGHMRPQTSWNIRRKGAALQGGKFTKKSFHAKSFLDYFYD
jgi:hypothetical protein